MSSRSSSPVQHAMRVNLANYGWAFFVSALVFGTITLIIFAFWLGPYLSAGKMGLPLVVMALILLGQAMFAGYVFSVGSGRGFKMGFALTFALGAVLGGVLNGVLVYAGLGHLWSYLIATIFVFVFGLWAAAKFYPVGS